MHLNAKVQFGPGILLLGSRFLLPLSSCFLPLLGRLQGIDYSFSFWASYMWAGLPSSIRAEKGVEVFGDIHSRAATRRGGRILQRVEHAREI